jgi:RNA polymerase sigma factor (sigma-70 family)
MSAEEYARAYERTFGLAVRFFCSRGVPYEDAVESVQAAWAKGWERRHQLRQTRSILPWIISIARNIRNTTGRELAHVRSRPAQSAFTPADATAAIDVERLLDRSKPGERMMLKAHYLEGFTAQEIADAHGLSRQAVRLRLLRARKKAKSDPKSSAT